MEAGYIFSQIFESLEGAGGTASQRTVYYDTSVATGLKCFAVWANWLITGL